MRLSENVSEQSGITITTIHKFENGTSGNISLVMGVNMRHINLNTEGGIFDGYIDLFVHDRDILDKMIVKLQSIKGIQSVMRTDL